MGPVTCTGTTSIQEMAPANMQAARRCYMTAASVTSTFNSIDVLCLYSYRITSNYGVMEVTADSSSLSELHSGVTLLLTSCQLAEACFTLGSVEHLHILYTEVCVVIAANCSSGCA